MLVPISTAAAVTLPNPPDRSAPANNQTGPLPNAQSFNGGVLLVKDGSTDQNVSASEFVAEYLCYNHNTTYVSKPFETGIGESVAGTLTAAQASGVIDAVNSVRPPETAILRVNVGALDTGGNLTYVIKGITENVTTYSVWTTTQQSPPAEQRVGYVVVSVPVKPLVTRFSTDMAGSSCSDYALFKMGAGFGLGPTYRPSNVFGSLSTPPEGGLAPIFTYGTVKVLSGAGVAAAADIKPGENVTFSLSPGAYSAVADVTLFGIPFSVGSGTYSSPPGAATAQFTVSLNSLNGIWYGLETVALILLVAIVLLLDSRLHLSRALAHASKYFYRVLRSGWRKVWESDMN